MKVPGATKTTRDVAIPYVALAGAGLAMLLFQKAGEPYERLSAKYIKAFA